MQLSQNYKFNILLGLPCHPCSERGELRGSYTSAEAIFDTTALDEDRGGDFHSWLLGRHTLVELRDTAIDTFSKQRHARD
jgi:hypothetical protein